MSSPLPRDNLILLECCVHPEDSAVVDVSVGATPAQYDSGRFYRVTISNSDVKGAVENEALADTEDGDRLSPLVMETLQSQYAQLPPNDSLLRLQTTASFDVVLTDEGPLQRAFPSVPEELLSIPQAFIDDLTYTSTLTSHVDLVKLSEGTVKVFKRYPPIPPSHDALLPEALVLAAVESAQILKPTHVVVSRHGDDMYFRGFLMPYLSHGTLAEYLGSNTLDWATKIRWAIQIAAGVSSLHCRGFYCGDIRLENILISDDQKDVVLIDVGPVPALVPPYTPPEVVGSQLLTGPRDIYAVGIILAAFVLGNGEAKYPDDNDLADAPDPYRTIVLECLDCDPLKRPTPEKLVDALKSCDEVPVL